MQQRSFSKADAKVVSFTIQSKSFYEKCAQKHIVFDLFYRIGINQAKSTFYIFMRAKETVDGNRINENERKGRFNGNLLGKGGENKEDGEVRMRCNEGEWR